MKSRNFILAVTVAVVTAMTIPTGLAAQDDAAQSKKAHHHHYKLIDMGTFGGPNSNPAQDFSLNQRGVMVGWSATPNPTTPTSNPIVCGGVDGSVPFITVSFQWQDGILTDLGALPGGSNCSEPFQLNDRGEIVGTSENGLIDPVTGVDETRAVRWEDGEIEDLGSFGGTQNAAQGINSHGQVSGWSLNTIPDTFPLNPFGATQTRAFLWQILWQKGKGMQDLGTLGGAYGFPNRLNNRGQVVGFSSLAASPGACFIEFDPNCHVFLWDSGKLTDLTTSTIGGGPITPDGFNDAREIVGAADFSSSGGSPFDAYLWVNGVATDLGALAPVYELFSENCIGPAYSGRCE
jgi:hypothetical protein